MNTIKESRKFLQLEPYLDSVFNKTHLLIYTPFEKTLIKNLNIAPHKWPVKVTNGIITGNLRMIGSYFPEKLALLCLNNLDKSQSLLKLIDKVSKNHFLYRPQSFAKRVITYRLVDLIRIILFSEFLTKVWDGQYINNRIFVAKDKLESKYFTFYESMALAKGIIENVNIESKVLSSNNDGLVIDLSFVMTNNLF